MPWRFEEPEPELERFYALSEFDLERFNVFRSRGFYASRRLGGGSISTSPGANSRPTCPRGGARIGGFMFGGFIMRADSGDGSARSGGSIFEFPAGACTGSCATRLWDAGMNLGALAILGTCWAVSMGRVCWIVCCLIWGVWGTCFFLSAPGSCIYLLNRSSAEKERISCFACQ